MAETKRVAKATVTVEGTTLTFKFTHGATAVIGLGQLTEEMRLRLAMHGLEQKVRDSYAGADSSQEAEGLAQKVIDNLSSGLFNAKREASGESVDTVDLLVKAIERAMVKADKAVPEGLAEMVKNADKATRAKYRAMAPVALALAEIKAEIAAANPAKPDPLSLFA